MRRRSFGKRALALLLAGSALMSGCKAPSWGASKKKKDVDPGPLVKAPADRVDELKEIAKGAKKLSPADQEKISNELAGTLRSEQDPVIRMATLRALGEFPTASASAALRAALEDRDTSVRIQSCETWAKRKGPDAVPALSFALGNDADVDVRIAAARALGEVDDKGAVPALAIALDARDPALQYRGIEALRKYSKTDYGGDVALWREFAKGGRPRPKEESIVQRVRGWFN